MKSIYIYSIANGWMYEVWLSGRPLVIGYSKTRERAEQEAASA